MKTLFLSLIILFLASACDRSNRVTFESDSSSLLETGSTALVTVRLSRSTQTGLSDVNAPNTAGNQEVRVPYTVSGTASFGVNHQLSNGTIVFPKKSQEVQLRVPVLHHTEYDGDRTVIISLGNPEGATLGAIGTHTLTIQEVDIAPFVNFISSAATVSEGAGSINLGVSLEYASQADAVIGVSFSGTAQMGVDFTASSSLTIPAGQTSAVLPITPIDNLVIEGNRTLVVTLTSPNGALLGPNVSFTLSLVDNDNLPTVSFSSSTQTLSEAVGSATVTVNMNKTYALDVLVPFTVSGTATAVADHNLSDGTITVLAGSLTASTSFSVINDSLDENNETIVVTMGSITNGNSGSPSTQTITITDDDPTPTVQFSTSTQTVSEGSGTVTVRANLSAVSGRNVTIPFTVTGTASNPADHNFSNGNISITAGASFGTTTFNIVDDSIYEGNETVIVTMGSPTNATASGTTTQTVTISENDSMPVVSLASSSQSVSEGDSGQTTVTVTVNLSAASAISTSIPFSWSGTASNGSDYSVQTASPITISAGSTSKTISMTVNGDTMYEPDETAIVTLGSPTGASLGSPSVHTVTITNEDPVPVVYFNGDSSSASEGAGMFVINIIATNSNQSNMVIPYTVTGTATNPSDHNLSDGSLTLTSGNVIGNISFSIVNDAVAEGNETVILTLGSPTNATGGVPSQFTLTINDNDRGFDLGKNLLWMDSQFGLVSQNESAQWSWEPRHSKITGNCGFGNFEAVSVDLLWKDLLGVLVDVVDEDMFKLAPQEGGSLFLVEKASEVSKAEAPKIRKEMARDCRELTHLLENPVIELLWIDSGGTGEDDIQVVNYLSKKYTIEWME